MLRYLVLLLYCAITSVFDAALVVDAAVDVDVVLLVGSNFPSCLSG